MNHPPVIHDEVHEWNLGDIFESELLGTIKEMLEQHISQTVSKILRQFKLQIDIDESEQLNFCLWADHCVDDHPLIGDTNINFSPEYILEGIEESYDDDRESLQALAAGLRAMADRVEAMSGTT